VICQSDKVFVARRSLTDHILKIAWLTVLLCCCAAVLLCCCAAVLLCCCAAVLLCLLCCCACCAAVPAVWLCLQVSADGEVKLYEACVAAGITLLSIAHRWGHRRHSSVALAIVMSMPGHEYA
jgi:hypothetical protein